MCGTSAVCVLCSDYDQGWSTRRCLVSDQDGMGPFHAFSYSDSLIMPRGRGACGGGAAEEPPCRNGGGASPGLRQVRGALINPMSRGLAGWKLGVWGREEGMDGCNPPAGRVRVSDSSGEGAHPGGAPGARSEAPVARSRRMRGLRNATARACLVPRRSGRQVSSCRRERSAQTVRVGRRWGGAGCAAHAVRTP